MAQLQSHRGRLLDVGCSIGTLMSVARGMDWEVEGLEPNPKAADLARKQGFPIREGFFSEEQVRELSGGYQCVVMSDVIEHISDPVEALRLAGELLEPGGFLLVSTPNLESFWCRKFPGVSWFSTTSRSMRPSRLRSSLSTARESNSNATPIRNPMSVKPVPAWFISSALCSNPFHEMSRRIRFSSTIL